MNFQNETEKVFYQNNSTDYQDVLNSEFSYESTNTDTRCFTDYFSQLAFEDELNDKLHMPNINQANVYWKQQRKQPKFIHQYYLLGDTIGRGSYGKVKDAIDIRTLKRYAIKIVCRMKIKKIPGGMKHVESEIALMKTLNHKNIVKLIDEFHENDPERRCIVMEFCLGSIHDLQTNGILESSNQFRRLPEWQAHSYFLQMIDGIEYLHNQRLIHKDLKPGNFLLTEHEILKITDFGVSEKFDIFKENSYITGGQTTPAIQPPELAGGSTKVCGYKLDIYGAGVSLYFMLCGRVPFNTANVLLIFDEIVTGKYTIPDYVSHEASSLIRAMMNKNVKKRYDLYQIRQHNWFHMDHIHNHATKIDPREYLSYSTRDPTKNNLYQLSSGCNVVHYHEDLLSRQNLADDLAEYGQLKELPENQLEPAAYKDHQIESSGLPAIMPLSVLSRLRTYYDWPMTNEEEQQLQQEQVILSDDFIGYQDDNEVSMLSPQQFTPHENDNELAYPPDFYNFANPICINMQSSTPLNSPKQPNKTKESNHGIKFFIESDSNENNFPLGPSHKFVPDPQCHRIQEQDQLDTESQVTNNMSVSFSLPSAMSVGKEIHIDFNNQSTEDMIDDNVSRKTDPIIQHNHCSPGDIENNHRNTSSNSPHHHNTSMNSSNSPRGFLRSKFKPKRFSSCRPS